MRVIIVLALFISFPSYAHRLGGCGHDHGKGSSRFCAEEIVPDGEVSSQQLIKLMDEAHHALEAESGSSSFLGTWSEKFRFKEMGLNAYRWYSAHKERPEVANASANIVVMLLASHAMETVGGLGLASFGMGQHSHVAQMVLTTIGVSVTVPGLDPLCIVLVGAYSKWPKAMNRWLTLPRMFVVQGARTALGMAGIPDGYLQARYAQFAKEQFMKELTSEAQLLEVRELRPERALFRIPVGEEDFVELLFSERPKLGMSLEEVYFQGPLRESEILKRGLRPFGTNIAELILDLVHDRPTSMSYLQTVRFSSLYNRHVKIMPGAFPFHDFTEEDCQTLLLPSTTM